MKKIILTIAFIGSGLMASAQVGVGTENPQTSLHIVGANATDKGTTGTNAPGALAATDGITVPVVTTEMTAPGTPVAGTKVGQLVYSNFAGKTGFYYWNGTIWTAVAGGGAQVAVPYQNIQGGVSTVTAGSYTILAGDYAVVTNHTAGVTLTFPNLTLADAGRTVFVFNNNTGSFNNAIAGTNVIGIQTNTQLRGMEIMWTGAFWIIIGK